MLNYQRVIWFNGICVDCLLPRIGRLLNQVDQRPHLCLGLLVWPGAETLGLQMLWLGKRVDGQLMVITCHYFKSLATNGKVYKPAKACRASKITVAMIYNVFIYHLANAKTINQLNFGCLPVYICEHVCIFVPPSCLEVSTCHSLCLSRGKIMEKNGAWLVLARWVLWNGHEPILIFSRYE